jgi:hypothetical protein
MRELCVSYRIDDLAEIPRRDKLPIPWQEIHRVIKTRIAISVAS